MILPLENSEYIRACYLNGKTYPYKGHFEYNLEKYVSGLCTHLYYRDPAVMNAVLKESDDRTQSSDVSADGYIEKVIKLKEKQPGLKIGLSLAFIKGMKSEKLEILSNFEKRKKFVNSAVRFVNEYGFDGIDVSWYYSTASSDANFTFLMQELKAASENKIITITVIPVFSNVDIKHNISLLSESVDFVKVETYNFRRYPGITVNHHSPLYSRPEDASNMNVAFVLDYWTKKGIPKNKLVMGIAAYGRGERSANFNNKNDEKKLTNVRNIKIYYDICNLEGNRSWEDIMEVPYIVGSNFWYGYDNAESIKVKMEWIKKNGFGGAYISDLNFDDFMGICGEGKSPLTNAIKKYLEKSVFSCPSPKGTFPDPVRCTRFYRCLHSRPSQIYCPPRKEFDEKSMSCVPAYGCSLSSNV